MRRSRPAISRAPDPAAAARARTRFPGRREVWSRRPPPLPRRVRSGRLGRRSALVHDGRRHDDVRVPVDRRRADVHRPRGRGERPRVARGAGGGTSIFGGAGGGHGAVVSGDLAVPGTHVLYVEVGGVPTLGALLPVPALRGRLQRRRLEYFDLRSRRWRRLGRPHRDAHRPGHARLAPARRGRGWGRRRRWGFVPRRGGRRRGGTRPARPGRRFLCAHRRHRRRRGHGGRGRSRRGSRR